MQSPVALVDATGHDDRVPPDLEVAGLGLVERTLRLAAVADCRHALVLHRPETASAVAAACENISDDRRFDLTAEPVALEEGADLAATVSNHLGERLRPETTLLALSSTRVYERGPVQQLVEAHHGADGLSRPPGDERIGPALLDGRTWTQLADLPADRRHPLDDALLARAEDRHVRINAVGDIDAGWRIDIGGPADAERATEKIWQGCIKPIDGPISVHLNRPVSLAVSRRLASTDVTPNLMSAVTFAIGLAATAAVAAGGYLWFLIGAILYQLSSILDGVDGELARGKYEFSITGEWVDTLSDNIKDIVFYLGLGYGAAQTVPGVFGVAGADLWMWLGGLAAFGKFLSLAGYATWLIPRGRGCVLIFDWGNDDEEPDDGFVARAFSKLEVLGKNDVVIFAAFLLGLVGGLHWFLALMAVGHHIAAAAIAARLMSPEVDIVPESAREPERVKAEG